jgi:hypothetical protein
MRLSIINIQLIVLAQAQELFHSHYRLLIQILEIPILNYYVSNLFDFVVIDLLFPDFAFYLALYISHIFLPLLICVLVFYHLVTYAFRLFFLSFLRVYYLCVLSYFYHFFEGVLLYLFAYF